MQEMPPKYAHLIDQAFGSFKLVGYAGEGSYGVVFVAVRAYGKQINVKYALKILTFAENDISSLEKENFRNEGWILQNLFHPNIVRWCGVGRRWGINYLVCEFVEGGSLADALSSLNGPLPPGYSAQLMQKVANAVAYAHGQNIIHRDLKPGNILLTKDGEPKVADFGTAKYVEDFQGTMTGEFKGTLAFMAPEQVYNKPTAKSDIYSLGATFYNLLTGRPPFTGSPLQIAAQLMAKIEIPAPREIDNTIPEQLDRICMRCLKWEPVERYQDCEELACDIGRFLESGWFDGDRAKKQAR